MSSDAESRPLRFAVFAAGSIVIDRNTVTVCLKSMHGSVKKHLFLWITPKICEITVVA